MAAFPCPSCGELTYAFGRGGGSLVAQTLSELTSQSVGELPSIPFDVRMSEEDGVPFIVRHPKAPASVALSELSAAILATARPKPSLSLNIVNR
jgi:MinD-like ATPase involved in chromosome partitioning or flagellar assembly